MARGLIVFLKYGLPAQAQVCLNYLETSFKDGLFVGFFDENRAPIVYPSSADAHGLAVWALSVASVDKNLGKRAKSLLEKVDMSVLIAPGYTRPLCYGVLAAEARDDKIETERLAGKLAEHYDSKTHWFEVSLRYANGALPLCLINSGVSKFEKIGLESLSMLDETMKIGIFPAPPGNREWHVLGSKSWDNYGQQPIDAAFMTIACVSAYEHTHEKTWLEAGAKWLSWFSGNNIWAKSLIEDDGSCMDGLDDYGPNPNCGSESTIMYLLALDSYSNQIVV